MQVEVIMQNFAYKQSNVTVQQFRDTRRVNVTYKQHGAACSSLWFKREAYIKLQLQKELSLI